MFTDLYCDFVKNGYTKIKITKTNKTVFRLSFCHINTTAIYQQCFKQTTILFYENYVYSDNSLSFFFFLIDYEHCQSKIHINITMFQINFLCVYKVIDSNSILILK